MLGFIILGTVAIVGGFLLGKGEGYHFLSALKCLFIQDKLESPAEVDIMCSKDIEEKYQLTSDTFSELNNQLLEVKVCYNRAIAALAKVESKIDSLVQEEDTDGLQVLLKEKVLLLGEIDNYGAQEERLLSLVVKEESTVKEYEIILKKSEVEKLHRNKQLDADNQVAHTGEFPVHVEMSGERLNENELAENVQVPLQINKTFRAKKLVLLSKVLIFVFIFGAVGGTFCLFGGNIENNLGLPDVVKSNGGKIDRYNIDIRALVSDVVTKMPPARYIGKEKKTIDFTKEIKEGAKEDAAVSTVKTLTIYFEPNLAVILEESYSDLQELVRAASLNGAKIQIEGNVADTGMGDSESGRALSEQRAKVVAQYLQSQGIDPTRIIIVGNGTTKPVQGFDPQSKEGMEANRRADIFFKSIE